MAFLIGGANSLTAAYNVENSLRFDKGSSSLLYRDQSTPTNNKICTLSCWVKRCALEGTELLHGGYPAGSGTDINDTKITFQSTAVSRLFCQNAIEDATDFGKRTNAWFRDFSAWYHVVLAVDTTDGTIGDRIKIYVNNLRDTWDGTYAADDGPDQNIILNWNVATTASNQNRHSIGLTGTNYCNMYLAEAVFIDGQQLTPSSFGEYDEDSGIWKPKSVGGLTFGDNGWYLEFKNSAVGSGASDTIGADSSGNDNHFTSSGVAVTDHTTDTPTNNFCTLNAINPTETNASFAEGNLKFTNTLNSSPHHGLAHGTMAVAKGKWYWEVRVDAIGGTAMGIGAEEVSAFGKNNVAGNQGISLFNHGYTHQRGSDVAVSGDTTYTTNDIIGVALDMDNRKIYFHKNGTYFNSGDPTSGATGTGAISFNAADVTMTPAVSNYNSGICNVNFGSPQWAVSSSQADDDGYGNFEYDVPASFFALCTKNLAEYG